MTLSNRIPLRAAGAALMVACGAGSACAQGPVPGTPPARFACLGEEPFWSLRGTAASATLTEPGAKAVRYKGAGSSLDYLNPRALVFRGRSVSGRVLVATLREEACSSTMAEGPARAWRAILSGSHDRAVTGCCDVE